ncbi:probable protein phosphatase 2C 80 isoform X2 [Cornus florida]|uniref:probable protein phosphatase 2C 80 isoform X2 n=1 Tax=Cornus florida TaxID=4283 RepID=UPI00289FA543|nr:probable protein phosphatase 2C 80 isoform X2 [Cornus florida]
MPSGFISNLNTAFCCGFQKSIRLQRGRSCNSIELLLSKRRFSILSCGLCYSSPVPSHTSIPSRPFTSRLVCDLGNQKNNLFVVGAVSQTHSATFVTGLTGLVSEYPSNQCCRKAMAASGSKAASRDLIVDTFITSCGNVSNFVKPTGVYFSDRNLQSCRKASMSLRNREPTNARLSFGYFIFDVTRRSCNPLVGSWLRDFHTSSSPNYSDRAVPDVSFDESSCDEQVGNAAVSADQTLKLLSGSCYLPHPDKEETGGEDAHFICVDEQAIGVADGVGGWADVGVNAGLFSRELMSHTVTAIQDEPKGSIDPSRVLEKAHSITKAKGSSTACIIALTNQQGIHAINLGDSGFIVVREGCTIFQSPVQQHGFNFTYQLESGNGGDLPSSGEVFTIPVAPGDVVVAGTDGLFDNLYNNEITAAVVHAVRDGLGPQVTAQKIAALARQRAQDRNRQTPFSTAAQNAGFRYYGGKLDDITVVVSYITSST